MNPAALQKKILDYYHEHRRDLPWRKTTNRYKILIAEVMLQQTQADRVIPKYERWLRVFPTINALAAAPLSKVLQEWSGLGYNNRAKRLHDTAKIITKHYNGIVPNTREALIKLPGIGPYTASSILIFADNQDLVTVDTNIRRILIKELQLKETTTDKELFTIAKNILPKGKSREWHNALMDYGAAVLTAKQTGIKPRTRQSTFKGSRRQYRGRIIKHLAQNKKATMDEIQKLFPENEHDPKALLKTLEKEGLIEKKGGAYKLKT